MIYVSHCAKVTATKLTASSRDRTSRHLYHILHEQRRKIAWVVSQRPLPQARWAMTRTLRRAYPVVSLY